MLLDEVQQQIERSVERRQRELIGRGIALVFRFLKRRSLFVADVNGLRARRFRLNLFVAHERSSG
jgi:hypothetical protein